jgi:hypothetical protein
VWRSVYVPLLEAFVFDDARWLNEMLENRRKLGALLQTKDVEAQYMDKNEFEEKWKIIKDQSKVWWSLITDVDLKQVETADVKFFEYVSILQLKYGYERQVAKDEIAKRVAEYETTLKTMIATRP